MDIRLKSLISLLPILAVAATGAAASYLVANSKPDINHEVFEEKTRAVKVVVARSESRILEINAQGSVKAKQVIDIIPRVNGQITFVSDDFVDGGRFREGQIILTIDQRDYQLAVISAEAQVAETYQLLVRETAEADVALSQWVSKRGEKPSDLAMHKPQLAGAQAKLKSAEAELEKARLNFERTNIRAPFNGIVTKKQVDFGQYVSVGIPLSRFSSTDVLEVRLSLANSDLANVDFEKLNNGQADIDVVLSATFSQKTNKWHGKIVRSEGTINMKTRNLYVVAQFSGDQLIADDGRTNLTIGQFVQARIQSRLFQSVFVLPRIALHHGNSIYVVDEDSRLRSRTVHPLNIDQESVLISKGISDGDLVCISPITQSSEGMTVNWSEAFDPKRIEKLNLAWQE